MDGFWIAKMVAGHPGQQAGEETAAMEGCEGLRGVPSVERAPSFAEHQAAELRAALSTNPVRVASKAAGAQGRPWPLASRFLARGVGRPARGGLTHDGHLAPQGHAVLPGLSDGGLHSGRGASEREWSLSTPRGGRFGEGLAASLHRPIACEPTPLLSAVPVRVRAPGGLWDVYHL